MNAVIFDFDGTIADSFDEVVGFLLQQAGRGGASLTADERQQLMQLSMRDLALRVGVPAWKLPLVYIRGKSRLKRRMHKVPPFAGIEAVLATVHHEQYQLFIISSNNRRNINRFLSQHGLSGYFTAVYGNAGWFGKAATLRRAFKRHGLSPRTTVYVGDEVRDVLSARLAGMPSIAVSWGFSSHDQLQQHNPTVIVDTPAQLQKTLVEWGKDN